MPRERTEFWWIRLLAWVVFAGGWIAWLTYWVVALPSVEVESARSTLKTVAGTEASLLGFTMAAIAFAMNTTVAQARSLEPLKTSLLGILSRNCSELGQLVAIYEARFQAAGTLPEDFKHQQVSHLTDSELVLYLRSLVSLASKDEGKTKPLDPTVSELESDPVVLFRVACGALLSPFCSTMASSNKVVLLSATLRQMDVRHNIVKVVNNMFDIRRAARRGFPLFYMMLLASWIGAIAALSGLSKSSVNLWAYGLAVLPMFILAIAFAYYIDQVLTRYLQ